MHGLRLWRLSWRPCSYLWCAAAVSIVLLLTCHIWTCQVSCARCWGLGSFDAAAIQAWDKQRNLLTEMAYYLYKAGDTFVPGDEWLAIGRTQFSSDSCCFRARFATLMFSFDPTGKPLRGAAQHPLCFSPAKDCLVDCGRLSFHAFDLHMSRE